LKGLVTEGYLENGLGIFDLTPSCSLKTINNPIEACGRGGQFFVIFQRN
jgi:hypothetical protein